MKVLISHTHSGVLFASRVTKALEGNGFEVGDPARGPLSGDSWTREASRALEESEAMIELLTPASTDSPYVKREVEYALGTKNFCHCPIPVVVGGPDRPPASTVPWIVQCLPSFDVEGSESEHPQVSRLRTHTAQPSLKIRSH